ncbi:MAG: hypothetical protein GY835_10850 [bacterium]|nr:hypothetical protein [bacterium]
MALFRRYYAPAVLAVLVLLSTTAFRVSAQNVENPDDPLRSTLGFSFGNQIFDNADLKDYFEQRDSYTWTLRYDFRTWHFFRLGIAISANDKLHHVEEISLGSDEYPIRYSFSAFQAEGELYLRTELPRVFKILPHVSIGTLYNHLHVESSGYTEGYDAFWEELSPAVEVKTNSRGWRVAMGCQVHFWANVNVFFEASKVTFDAFATPKVENPPLNDWDWSGTRFEIGLMQRF